MFWNPHVPKPSEIVVNGKIPTAYAVQFLQNPSKRISFIERGMRAWLTDIEIRPNPNKPGWCPVLYLNFEEFEQMNATYFKPKYHNIDGSYQIFVAVDLKRHKTAVNAKGANQYVSSVSLYLDHIEWPEKITDSMLMIRLAEIVDIIGTDRV